jgi:phosphotriesterase-related protein
MHRRCFLEMCAAATATATLRAAAAPASAAFTPSETLIIQTVRGAIPRSDLGRTLPHEHVLVDFIGADAFSPERYRADAVFSAVIPHLSQVRALGIDSIFECTPAHLGRDPKLLARLSVASGLHLITNTGLYGARNDKFIPTAARSDSAEALARTWIEEAKHGIEDTGIRPGFIKCGVDAGPVLSPLHRRLVAAAAMTHAETGLTIAVHTGRGPGREQLDVLREHGIAAPAFVWVHAQGAPDDELFAAADRGAWLSLDGLNQPTVQRHLQLCIELKRRGHLGRVLLSHDAGWFDPAKPGGGEFRPFTLLATTFLPLLRDNGFSTAEIDLLTIRNPAEAFAVRRRLR